jgi:hypothetical protein
MTNPDDFCAVAETAPARALLAPVAEHGCDMPGCT